MRRCQTTAPKPHPKLLYSRRDAASALGISQWMLRKLTHNGELRTTSIGSRVMYSDDELRRFVTSHTGPALDALTQEGD